MSLYLLRFIGVEDVNVTHLVAGGNAPFLECNSMAEVMDEIDDGFFTEFHRALGTSAATTHAEVRLDSNDMLVVKVTYEEWEAEWRAQW
jgi:hypothetical protein